MKVRELRMLIEGLPDDTPVLVPESDHGYQEVRCEVTTGLQDRRGRWTEDYGEEATPEAEYGKRKTILLVGA